MSKIVFDTKKEEQTAALVREKERLVKESGKVAATKEVTVSDTSVTVNAATDTTEEVKADETEADTAEATATEEAVDGEAGSEAAAADAITTETVITEEVAVDGIAEGEVIADESMPAISKGMDGGMVYEDGMYTDPMAETGMVEVKDPLLSSWPFVIGVSSAVLLISVALGVLLARRKIKKGIELYED